MGDKLLSKYEALLAKVRTELLKEHCRKKPVCDGCPLVETCGRCGI